MGMTPERQAELRALALGYPGIHAARLLEALDALRDAEELRKGAEYNEGLVMAERDEARRDSELAKAALGLDNWDLALMYRNERELRDEARAERDEARRQLGELKAVHDYCHFASPSDPTGVRRGLTEVANANLRDRLRAVEGVLATVVGALERMIHTIDAEALHWPVKVHIKKCIGEAQDALAAAEAVK